MIDNDEKLDKAFTLRVSSRLYDAVLRRARSAKRKPADWIRVAVEEKVEQEDKKGP